MRNITEKENINWQKKLKMWAEIACSIVKLQT